MNKQFNCILLIAFIIFGYGSMNIYLANKYEEPFYLIWTAFCFIAVAGLLLNKAWSKFIVYLLSTITIFGWVYFTYFMYQNNWQGYEQNDIYTLFIIGVVLISLSLFSSIYTRKYFFNKSSNK